MFRSLPALLLIVACSGRAAPAPAPVEVAPADGPSEPSPVDRWTPVDGVPGLDLPRSTGADPVEPAATLTVSGREVALDRRPLAELGPDGALAPGARQGLLVPAVREALETARLTHQEAELLHTGAVGEPPHLNLAIHAATPWSTVAALVYTAGQSGYLRHDLLVRGAAGDLRAVRVELPGLADLDRPVGLHVRVDPGAFAFLDAGGAPASGPPETTRVDAAGLKVAARARKAAAPDAASVHLDIAPTATWADVIAAIDATRADDDGAPLFPRVLFGSRAE